MQARTSWNFFGNKNLTIDAHDSDNDSLSSTLSDENNQLLRSISTTAPTVTNFSRIKKISASLLKTIQETLEGCSIAYGIYEIFIYEEGVETRLGYILVGAGGLISGLTELASAGSYIAEPTRNFFRVAKEAIAGATMIALFSESFLPPDTTSVGIGATIIVAASASKIILESFKNKQFFNSYIGKTLQYSLGGIYDAATAAGVSLNTSALIEGLGTKVSISVQYGTLAAVSASNLIAGLPIIKRNTQSIFNKPARAYQALIYGSKIFLFSTILLLDIITDIRKTTDLKNYMVYLILISAAIQGLIAIFSKFINDNRQQSVPTLADSLSRGLNPRTSRVISYTSENESTESEAEKDSQDSEHDISTVIDSEQFRQYEGP